MTDKKKQIINDLWDLHNNDDWSTNKICQMVMDDFEINHPESGEIDVTDITEAVFKKDE